MPTLTWKWLAELPFLCRGISSHQPSRYFCIYSSSFNNWRYRCPFPCSTLARCRGFAFPGWNHWFAVCLLRDFLPFAVTILMYSLALLRSPAGVPPRALCAQSARALASKSTWTRFCRRTTALSKPQLLPGCITNRITHPMILSTAFSPRCPGTHWVLSLSSCNSAPSKLRLLPGCIADQITHPLIPSTIPRPTPDLAQCRGFAFSQLGNGSPSVRCCISSQLPS